MRTREAWSMPNYYTTEAKLWRQISDPHVAKVERCIKVAKMPLPLKTVIDDLLIQDYTIKCK